MPHLPTRFAGIILAFAPLFVHRSWRHAQVLLIGAILAPGRRTVTSLLKIMGRSRERRFVNFHRILSRAAWYPRVGARILLGLLIDAFAPNGPVVLALDDTIERRWGRRIRARGIYRDPVRSSDGHFVKASGLPFAAASAAAMPSAPDRRRCRRWMSLMLLASVPWAGRVWALPFLTALVPSERACRERGRRHKPLLDVGRNSSCRRAAGCRGAIWCWSATAASPPSRSSTPCAAAGSRPSPACAWMLRSTSLPHHGGRARSADPERRGRDCPPWQWC